MFMLWQDFDARVVRRVLAGRRDDFGILVERYLPAAQAVARGNLINPADTEDVAQESFVAAFQKLDTLRAPQRFGPWFITIVRNTARTWSRRQSRETSLEAINGLEPAVDPPAAEKEEMRRTLEQTLSTLEAEPREILMLHYFAGKSLREIAAMTGISREAAAKRLQRARAALGEELLKAVPEARPSRESNRVRARAILAAVAAAPVAWHAAPAYAATAFGAGALLKLFVTAAVLAGTAGALYVAGPQVFPPRAETVPAESGAASAHTTVDQTAAAEEAAETVSETPQTAATETSGSFPPTGTETISSMLVDLQDRPIPNADVYLELVNWAATETPPEPTARWSTQADADGKFRFENLPPGPYCITAFTPGMGGANDANIVKEHGYIPRNVKMYPIMPCSGVIRDETGAPIAGAVLYPVKHVLFPDEEFDHWTIASTRAVSDADGKFAFKGLIPGGWILYVVAPGRPPAYTEPVQVPATNAEVVLGGPGSLAGRVVDSRDGEPMPYVKLALVQGDTLYVAADATGAPVISERVRHAVQSGEDGTFRAEGLMPGEYRVRVEDPMLCLADPRQATRVETGKETQGFDIRVSTGGLIAGRITDKVSGAGIAGVDVNAYSSETGTGKSGQTDGSGQYQITGLPPGQYRVDVYSRVPGYLPSNMSERMVQAAIDQPQEGVDFTLEPGVTVSGTVVDGDGNLVEGAEVSGNTGFQTGDYSYDRVETDAAGAFALTRLRGGTELRLDAVKGDWRAKPYEGPLGNGGLADITMRLDVLAGSAIEGRVLDSGGKPLGKAYVQARQAGEDQPAAGVEAEMSGLFKLEGLQAGRYILTASPTDYGMYHTGLVVDDGSTSPETTVDVAERKTVKDVVVRCEIEANLTITGKVLSPSGRPMLYAALTVEGLPRYSTAKLDGSFEIDGLGKGAYTVYAAAPGYSPAVARNVPAGTRDLTLRLENLAILRGRVIDATANAPLDAFTVEYTSTSQLMEVASPGLNGTQTFTDAKGEFRIEGMSTLPTVLRVRANGYAMWETQLEGLVGGQENEILAELERGATIRGFVHDAAGQPLGQVQIQMSTTQPGYPVAEAAAVTTADGAFELRDVTPGEELRLVASREGFAPSVVTVTPEAGGVTPADVLLEEGGSLRIRAFQNGRKAQEFSVHVYDETGAGYGNRGDIARENGEYLYTSLPAGELTVTVSLEQGDTYLNRGETVSIVSGQETLLDVEFSGSGVIEGTVMIGGAAPEQGIVILEGETSASVHLGGSSEFSFTGLPAGEYRVRLFTQDPLVAGARLEETIVLGEGDRQRVDWNFDGGGAIQGAVAGMEPDCSCSVMVVRGEVDAPAFIQQLGNEEAMLSVVRMTQTDADGRFGVGYLEPGAYTLIAVSNRPGMTAETTRLAGQVVLVGAHGTAEVALTLREQ